MTPLAVGLIGLALLMGPGWWWANRQRLPAPALFGFLSGALAMVTLVLVLQLIGGPLSRLSLGAGWLLFVLAVARLFPPRPTTFDAPSRTLNASWWPFALCALPTIIAMAWRAIRHPLFGFDTDFRWGFLAELMVREHSLGFYPPVTPADFTLYAWPDGIPPLVSSAYLALYSLAGGVHPAVTVPFTSIQFILLLVGTAALTRRYFTERASAWSIALLGVTPLAAWSATMGQETGMTALGLVALLLYLPRDSAETTVPHLLASGIAMASLALAREYGWAFVLIGMVVAARRRLPRRGILALIALVALVAAPWYVRNAVRTGNPFYNLSLAGLFPVNEAHAALMAIYRETFTLSQFFRYGISTVALSCVAVTFTGLLGVRLGWERARSLVLAASVSVALWLVSVPYTAAGFTYASRVLSPALALGAALGGAWLAGQTTKTRRRVIAFSVVGLLSLYGAATALVLPDRVPQRAIDQWLSVDDHLASYHRHQSEALARIADLVRPARLLALGGNNAFPRLGIDAVPPWSPDAAVIFDRSLSPDETWARLKAVGIRFVLIARGDLNRRYLEACPAFAAAGVANLRSIYTDAEFVLFEIVSAPAPATSINASAPAPTLGSR